MGSAIIPPIVLVILLTGCLQPNSDPDKDGVLDNIDNCRNASNPPQEDPDDDNIKDPGDNCPKNPNTGQEDTNDDNGNIKDTGDNCSIEDDDGCPDKKPTAELVRLDFRVTGIYCVSCVWALEYKLERMGGMITSRVSDDGSGIAVYDPLKLDGDTIVETLRNSDPRTTYGVKINSEENCTYHQIFRSTTYCCDSGCYSYGR